MTGLLVSVRSALEARLAYQGGADIVDIKEPHLGSLGAATSKVWCEVYDTINQRVPVSVALGEVWEGHVARPNRPFAFAKIGVAGCPVDGYRGCRRGSACLVRSCFSCKPTKGNLSRRPGSLL